MASTGKQVFSSADIARSIRRIAHEIVEHNQGFDSVVLVGIHTRGVPLSSRLSKALTQIANRDMPVGSLDIGMYRDDLGTRPTPELGVTSVPSGIDDKDVVLVDDVLYTGRTIRAALDALSDIGRPRTVQLAVLVDRGHRQLPIRADYVGKNLPTSDAERVTVRIEEIDGEDGVWIEVGSCTC